MSKDIIKNSNIKMSLKEITDLLEARHENAMRMVKRMIGNNDFGHATQIEYHTSNGNKYKTYEP